MTWTIDPSHSAVEFSVKHMMFATVRGRFNKFSGTVDLNEANPTQSKVEGQIEVASIDTGEANRDTHLRSADFFDVDNYPLMTFRSTRIEPAGQDQYKVTGDLTIKDVTRPVTFDVTETGRGKDPWGNQRVGVSADTTLNRKDFGLNWNVALETGGWLVGDQIKIHAELELVKQAEAVPA